jgi:hypothetical protein
MSISLKQAPWPGCGKALMLRYKHTGNPVCLENAKWFFEKANEIALIQQSRKSKNRPVYCGPRKNESKRRGLKNEHTARNPQGAQSRARRISN